MEVKSSRPVFNSVVDLGLRDVGVENNSRELAARLARASAAVFVVLVLSAMALCFIVAATGADPWVVVAFPLAWAVGMSALLLRVVKRARLVVVVVKSDGTNQAMWLAVVPLVFLALAALLAWEPLLIPLVVLYGILSLVLWRGRGRVPELLSKVCALLALDEWVLGDGFGLARRARSQRDALRLVIATDRRVLVAGSTRSAERYPVVDVPYRHVSRFGIEWKFGGRAGELALTVDGVDGELAETHVISSIAGCGCCSGCSPPSSTSTRSTSGWGRRERRCRCCWPSPSCAPICGYVSGTRSSLAYIVPLNLLIAPAFFFRRRRRDGLMLVLSTLAAIGLWAGSALRRGPASPGRRAARGSLRYALSGPGLIRISGMLLAAMVALVATAGAAGFELTSLRLAVEEVTAKRVPVDGRSNLTGKAASLTYTPGPDLRELVTDEHSLAGPNDGARWELRSSFSKGYNVVSLAPLHLRAAARRRRGAGGVPGRQGPRALPARRIPRDPHGARRRRAQGIRLGPRQRRGYWYSTAWFPQPVHSVRLECIARGQTSRFKRLCAEAIASLRFPMARG